MITPKLILHIAPWCDDPFVHAGALDAAAKRYDIDTPQRVAMWLAQLAHESRGFDKMEEVLNYSAERLRQVFQRFFPSIEVARQYAHEPEKLANYVYDDINDDQNDPDPNINRRPSSRLGNTDNGDGWKYRGRGYNGLTGKDNYRIEGQRIGVDLVNFPDKAAEPETAALIAGSFWQRTGCNALADDGDFYGVTLKHNTAAEGFKSRERFWQKAKEGLHI